MKLTANTPVREIEKAAAEAALKFSAKQNGGIRNYAFAFGVLEGLVSDMARSSPKAMTVLNDFIARMERATKTGSPKPDVCGDINCDGHCRAAA